ncbi:AAA-domain-containing protein [Bimuria novae-zelandiae CBS 107.79]|uniref:AAA-domain-containing protein n=1 Tax=Bimuria novae-zelandiae CBS 107.79 TaxID=1447943 RepID=A0A6A5VMR1_9PLEO|nr:AAA-domain-containing protein [Bimuria novae-zelandiae CBS 107.79]
MYGALRTGLRASHRRPPARFISRRRYPLSPIRARAFHASLSLANNNTPPADPDSKSVDNKDGERKKEEGATSAQAADAGDAVDDADMLAQKLQRSREMTRRYSSALRRSQRKNRAQDLPPVVVPSWFINECVHLSDEMPADQPLRQIVLELRRRGTDEAGSCSLPVHAPGAAVQLLSDFLFQAWGGGLDKDEKRLFARQWALSLGLPGSEQVLQELEDGFYPTSSRAASAHWLRKDDMLRDAEQTAQRLHDDTLAFAIASNELKAAHRARELSPDTLKLVERASERLNPSIDPGLPDNSRRDNNGYVPPFVLAEIRATIVASLSASQPSSSDSFPATKTNLVLHCPSSGRDRELASLLANIAQEQGADVITLNAQDLAEIAGDYLGDLPEPSPHSIRSLAYETYRLSADLENDPFVDEMGDEQEDAGASPSALPSMFSPVPGVSGGFPSGFSKALPFSIVISKTLTNALKTLQQPAQDASSEADTQSRPQTQAESQLEDLKIANVLENLIDASETKRGQQSRSNSDSAIAPSSSTKRETSAPGQGFFNSLMTSTPTPGKVNIERTLPSKAISQFTLSVDVDSATVKSVSKLPGNTKIIHVPDFKELNATHYGGRIIQKLEEIVRKRRIAGERIMIVGTTSSADLTPEMSKSGVQSLQSEGEAGFYRTIVVPVEKVDNTLDILGTIVTNSPTPSREGSKFRRVNIRHIFDMLRRLDPVAAQHLSARETDDSSRAAPALGSISGLSLSRILSYDEVHRISLVALGLHAMDPSSKHLSSVQVALAVGLLQASDQVKFEHVKREFLRGADLPLPIRRYRDSLRAATKKGTSNQDRDRDLERKLEKVSMSATKHEKRLMPGIANPAQIKTTFDQVHVPVDTIDSIRTLTSLSLLRPDAFNYGVLATEKISGALLYGPPGTGKTLLAKAVAKESGSTVLEVSGSQIMDKYVGEGEKNVTAVFSLARKLSPCIVFLDEADAIFSSRDVGRERTSHRDILNQFLKEWDGLNDLSVFVMVATNRPFDLDDAVIRRLPRRLLVDLPTEKDRAAILKIHLRGEQLDESVDLDDIAKCTPFYSGSDLKNLAVSAALACVKEENEQAAIAAATAASSSATESPDEQSAPTGSPPKIPLLVRGHDYKFPEKRVLSKKHFDAALTEISASINEDMGSLNAIKKFDEKYGDKKGKKTKHMFGIGVNKGTNEDVVRVRP